MAATSPALSPLYQQAAEYWDELVNECRKQMDVINTCLRHHGLACEHLVNCSFGSRLEMRRSCLPSTKVEASLKFYSWGPVISGTITGYDDDETSFGHEEFEMLIASDLDGATIAMGEEGKSLSPADVARYFTQSFRRCFPGISFYEGGS